MTILTSQNRNCTQHIDNDSKYAQKWGNSYLPWDDLSPYNFHKRLHDVQNKTDL